jgi:hypothetical protein
MKLETTKRQIAATKTARKTKAALTILFVLCALLLGSSSVKAQTQSDFQIWTAGFVTAQLRPEMRSPMLWFDAHARRGDEGTLLILRPGVGYMFAP